MVTKILPGYELWLAFIRNVHVVPARLDVERFKSALAKVSLAYPLTLGNLRSGSSWDIRSDVSLRDTIPLTIQECDSVDIEEDWVISTSDLSMYLPAYIWPAEDSGSALVQLKISLTTTATAIGVAWHHTLGDATTLSRFMGLLSALYQDPMLAVDTENFTGPQFDVPSSDILERFLPLMPHLSETFSTEEVTAKYQTRNVDTVCVRWRLPLNRLQALKGDETARLGRYISTQDFITSYVTTNLNAVEEGLIQQITNAASFRAHFTGADATSNPIYIIPTVSFGKDDGRNFDYILSAVRDSITNARDPEFIMGYMAVASKLMQDAADVRKHMFFGGDPHTLSVNSNLVVDWHSAHFGYPGRARFFTSECTNLYLRVFRSNPIEGDNQGAAIDIAVGVPTRLKEDLLARLRQDFP